MSNTTVRAGDYSECADADVIICAAGPSMIKNEKDAMRDHAQLAVVNSEVINKNL